MRAARTSCVSVLRGNYAMPTDVAVILAGFILVLIVFAGVLAWGDYYSVAERRAKKGQ
jgi:hypothetical protein